MIATASADSLRSSTQGLKNGMNDTKDDMRETANKVGHKVREFVDSSSEEITQATKTVTSHIHEKPMQSALIALGVGYVLGALFRR